MSQPLTDNQFWRRVKEIHDAAWELPAPDREAYLASTCGDDVRLRAEVDQMLAPIDADNTPQIILDQPLPFPSTARLYTDQTGEVVGRYRLVREIGRGGMSIVYLGERTDRDFEHQVAVKILRPGLESSGLAWRFSQERSILARLTHPHIARLIDGGTTANGQSYVVIEFVAGEPIDKYCERSHISLEARLRLFLTVCAAVAHAHRHLIVHRDLKPSNILVTTDGAPKLLDFGIAKLLEPSDGESRKTLTGLHLMTPDYASPEQVRGEESTTAGDVYSLGVVLYELLTGTRPHRLRNLSMGEIVRAICEQEPVRPSAIGTTEFREKLRGDLDQIVLKALRKEPDLRYASVDQLSDDLNRYLNGEPVSAQRDTLRYRTLKFIRRNRALAAALASTVLLLLFVLALTFRQLQAERARTREQYRMSYAPSMQQSLDGYRENIARMRETLERFLPGRGPEDLRGFEWRYLWQLTHREHSSLPTGMRVSTMILSESRHLEVTFPDDVRGPISGGFVRTYELETGRQVSETRRGIDLYRDGAMANDGADYAVVRNAREIDVFERSSDRRLKSFSVPGAPVNGLTCIKGNCSLVWINQTDGRLSLWSTETGSEIRHIETGHKDVVFTFGTPDYPFLLLFPRNSSGYFFDQRDRKTVHGLTLRWFGDLPHTSPSGRYLLENRGQKELRVYDMSEGRFLRAIDAEGGDLRGAWNHSSEDLLIAYWNEAGPRDAARIFLPPDYQRVKTFRSGPGSVRGAAYSEEKKLVFTGGRDGLIRVWDYESEREVAAIPGHTDEVIQVDVSRDGRWLTTSARDQIAKIWKVDELLRPDAINPAAGKVFSVAVSPDGKLIASGGEDRRVLVHDIKSGRLVRAFGGHTGMVLCVTFSPDGRLIASSGEDGAARVWDASTGNELLSLRHTAQIHSVAFSPDGRLIATGGDDNAVKVWDVATGALRREFTGLSRSIWSVNFDPSGQRLAAGDDWGTVKVWETETGRERVSFQAHPLAVWSIRFTRDGRSVLTGSMDRTARLWDAASGRELLRFKGHTDEVFAAVFSPDEARIATASNDKTVKIWDAATGEELLTLKDHRDEVWSVDFSPDGNLLASGSWDGTVRLYRANKE